MVCKKIVQAVENCLKTKNCIEVIQKNSINFFPQNSWQFFLQKAKEFVTEYFSLICEVQNFWGSLPPKNKSL
jgi:hypothetical protein